MLGALLWGIGASMVFAEENENAKVKRVEKELEYAKTIIQDLLDNCFGYNSKSVNYEIKAKAEQFLKENE